MQSEEYETPDVNNRAESKAVRGIEQESGRLEVDAQKLGCLGASTPMRGIVGDVTEYASPHALNSNINPAVPDD